MMNKIASLTKVFLKDFDSNFMILNRKRRNKLKDSNLFWIVIIVAIGVAYISYKAISFFNSIHQPKIFLSLYFIIFSMILMFQIILVAINVLFFSKDLEYILPMPVTSVELLLSKYVVLLITAYVTELLFTLVPLTIYGLLTATSFLYYIVMPIVLIIFPALFVTIISSITILLMKIFKIIRNKNVYQTLVTTLLVAIVLVFEFSTMKIFSEQQLSEEELKNMDKEHIQQRVIETYDKMCNSFLVINPSKEILSEPKQIGTVVLDIGKLFVYNIVALGVFVLIGRKVYLKNILLGTTAISHKKIYNKEIKYKERNNSIARAYIGKDFKQLLRNSTFFMQLIFPVLIILISIVIVGSFIIPLLDSFIQEGENITNSLKNIEFNSTLLCVILCALQVLYSMSGISLTAISRERESSIYLKTLPIQLYKQFLYKNVLQVILNLIVSIVILGIVYFMISKISVIQILLIFLISTFLNLINSFLMIIVDLRRPILNWDSEYQITKNNPNKIFQYFFMIITIIVLLYIAKLVKILNININGCIAMNLVVFLIMFIIINIYVKKNIRKLFGKII